jgi:hypothetical protein
MIPPLTILTCKTCGVQDTPRIEAGTAPHAARASCAHCGSCITWLGKAATVSPLEEGVSIYGRPYKSVSCVEGLSTTALHEGRRRP